MKLVNFNYLLTRYKSIFVYFMVLKILIWFVCFLTMVGVPSIVKACGQKAINNCCKKQSTNKLLNKKCCAKYKSQSSKDKNDCNGNCGSKTCHCPTYNFNLSLPQYLEIGSTSLKFFTKKVKFTYVDIHLSAGFYTIWSPPNIS